MFFAVENGSGLIKIGNILDGECLIIKKPRTFVWYDNVGSVGKYLALLPFSESVQKLIGEKYFSNVYTDFSGKEEELHKVLKPFLNLLANGRYTLNFYNSENKSFFQYSSSIDNFRKIHYADSAVFIAETTYCTDELSGKVRNYADRDLINKTTYGYYSYDSVLFIGTIPMSSIDKTRVAFFEDEIRNGKRPFALIISGKGEENYILDGHHKLLAYLNLKISPSIAVITQTNTQNIDAYLEELSEKLLPWQMEHFLEDEYSFIEDYLKTHPESNIK